MTSASASSSSLKEIPWEKCLWGCQLPEGASVVLLPCMHVVCTDTCLDKCSVGITGQDTQVQCRKCLRTFTSNEIKRDVKLEEFFKKKMKLEDVVLQCDHCIRNSPVASYCIQCEENLCVMCTEDHPLIRKTANHQLDMDLEGRKVIHFVKLKLADKQCKQEGHGEKETRFYCITCNRKLCEDCIMSGHSHHGAHKIVKIEDKLAEIQFRNQSSEKILEQVNLAIAKLEEKLESMKNPEWDDIVSGVNILMTRALEMFQQRQEFLLREGSQKLDVKRKQVKGKIEDLRRASKSLYSSSLLHVLDGLDDIGMINVAELRLALPQPDTPGCIKQLQNNFDGYVEKDNDPVFNDVVLPQLQTFFSRLRSSSSSSLSLQSGPGRKVAMKSTGGRKLNCRPLGMPHLDQKMPYEDHANGPSFTIETASGTTIDEIPNSSGVNGSTAVSGDGDLGESTTTGLRLSSDHCTKNGHLRKSQRKRQRKVYKDFIGPEDSPDWTTEDSRKTGKRKRMTDSNLGTGTSKRCNGNEENTAGSSGTTKAHIRSLVEFLDAPLASIRRKPDFCKYPIQGWIDPEKHSNCQNDDMEKYICNCTDGTCPCKDNDDCCAVCLQGGKHLLICEFCPRVFHLKCYAPIFQEIPEEDDWRCSCCTPKVIMEQELKDLRDEPGSKEKPLTDANPREFALACHFILQIYKIPEVPTIKFYFPQEYFEKYGKVPYHLNFLREKLCSPVKRGVQPYSSVREYLLAFQQMFRQAFQVYDVMKKNREHAVNCFKKFLELVKEYYPDHQDLFKNIVCIES